MLSRAMAMPASARDRGTALIRYVMGIRTSHDSDARVGRTDPSISSWGLLLDLEFAAADFHHYAGIGRVTPMILGCPVEYAV